MALTDGKLAAGAASPYIDTARAYGYASVTVVTAGRTLTFEPADYVRSELVRPGKCTYALGVDYQGLTIEILSLR